MCTHNHEPSFATGAEVVVLRRGRARPRWLAGERALERFLLGWVPLRWHVEEDVHSRAARTHISCLACKRARSVPSWPPFTQLAVMPSRCTYVVPLILYCLFTNYNILISYHACNPSLLAYVLISAHFRFMHAAPQREHGLLGARGLQHVGGPTVKAEDF